MPRWEPNCSICHMSEMDSLCMCQSCIDIDKQIERYRELLRSTTKQGEIDRISQLIVQLYADRVRLHKNPEQ